MGIFQSITAKKIFDYGIAISGVLIITIVWFNPAKPDVVDPWHRGTALLEKAKKEQDATQRADLIAQAGEILRQQNMLHPYHAKVWMLLGYYYLQSGALDSCIISEKKAIETGGGGLVNQIDHDAMELLNAALVQKLSVESNMDASLKTLRAAVIDGYENSMLDKYIGIVFSKYGMKDSSTFYLEKYIHKFPQDGEVLANLAFNYYMIGDINESLFYAERAYLIRKDILPLNQLLDELQKSKTNK